jgi:hypothetical protein
MANQALNVSILITNVTIASVLKWYQIIIEAFIHGFKKSRVIVSKQNVWY